MKKLFLLLPLILGLGLASCVNKSASSSHSEPEIVEPGEPSLSGIAVSGEFKTEYEIGEEFDATGIVVTALFSDESSQDVSAETTFTGFSSEVAGPCTVTAHYENMSAEFSVTILEAPVVYTAESVAADISELLGLNLTNKGTYWGVTINFSQSGVDYSNTQAEEDVLMPVIATLVNYYMPDYLELVGAKYFTSEEDFWEDESGDTAYYAYLEVEEVGVNLISYCYNGYLLGQISVFSTAE